jgi:hypothetical protein
MRTFPKTRAAAGYAARHARARQARPRPVKGGEQAMDDGTLAVQVAASPGIRSSWWPGKPISSPRRDSASAWPPLQARAGP